MNIENINQELYKIKDYIKNENFKESVFACDKIKNTIQQLFSDESIIETNSQLEKYKKEANVLMENMYRITRKYDYDHQDVFDKNDAEKMYYGIIQLIELYNKQFI